MDEIKEKFFGGFFAEHDRHDPAYAPGEKELVDQYVAYVSEKFSRMAYIVGLAIDFLLLAQLVSKKDAARTVYSPKMTEDELFAQYPLVESRGGRIANTLTVKVGDDSFGIRKLEELVRSYFYAERRFSYPSAYVYNTGQWKKYSELLLSAFALSSQARFATLNFLLNFSLDALSVSEISVISASRAGLFERVIADYPRSVREENGGLTLQAIAFAFISGSYPHLSLTADKVRTGSARQKRLGDIDAFRGVDLVLSFEVKDFVITTDNYEKELSPFVGRIQQCGAQGAVICQGVDQQVSEILGEAGFWVVSQEVLIAQVDLWDVFKQRSAVDAILYFLANIEHNESAVARLLSFIGEIGSE